MIKAVLSVAFALSIAGPAAAQTEADRAKYYALVQQKVTREHLWIPVLNINMHQVSNKKITDAKPHMIYQNTFYKGLDVSRQK